MKKRIFVFSFLLIYITISIGIFSGCDLEGLKSARTRQSTVRYFSNRIIAHAGGGMGGLAYLNSEEGLEYHYSQKTVLFEYDFAFSSDGHLIGIHNWENDLVGFGYSFYNRMSLAEYQNKKIAGKYRGMTFINLLGFMEKYDDISIILDTKESNEVAFYQKVVDDVKFYNEALLDRIIPQLYTREVYQELESMYAFKQYIYTLYKTNDSNTQVYNFLKMHNKVKILTVSEKRIKHMNDTYVENIYKLGKRVFVHTLNSFNDMDKYRQKGAEGFYSDFVTEKQYDIKYDQPDFIV
jgi:glycerophosphoryl diester phosphodiesterase